MCERVVHCVAGNSLVLTLSHPQILIQNSFPPSLRVPPLPYSWLTTECKQGAGHWVWRLTQARLQQHWAATTKLQVSWASSVGRLHAQGKPLRLQSISEFPNPHLLLLGCCTPPSCQIPNKARQAAMVLLAVACPGVEAWRKKGYTGQCTEFWAHTPFSDLTLPTVCTLKAHACTI